MPHRLPADQSGSVTVMMALSSLMVIGFAAAAIDLASVMLQGRKLQGIADLAALAAARDIDHAQSAAEATVAGNGWNGPISATVVTGAYVADPAKPSAQRFTPGAAPADGAKVTVTATADLFFLSALIGKNSLPISRNAVAAQARLASFSVGSRLAAVNGGVANAMLSAMTGSQVNLSAMDYNALVSANLNLLQYTQALATHLNIQGGSYSDVLSSSITGGEALSVFADQLAVAGDVAGAAATRKMAVAVGGVRPASLDRLIDLGPYQYQDHVSGGSGSSVSVNAMDLANALIQAAQGGRQIKIDLGAGVPGLADVTVWTAIGQRPSDSPWLTVAKDGSAIIRTTQMRTYIDAKLGATGALATLGVVQIDLPVLVEAASAEAKLKTIDCETGAATLSVAPSVGDLSIAQIDTAKLNDFTQAPVRKTAPLVSAPLISITGLSHVALGGMAWQNVSFSGSDISSGTVKTVSTNDLAQASVSSLLGNLDLGINLAGLGLGLGLGNSKATSSLLTSLQSAAAPLDGLINSLEDLSGAHLGQADVRVNGVRCHDAALVA